MTRDSLANPPDKKQRHPILIVDDEADVLISLRSMFRREYKVFAVTRPEDGLEILKAEQIKVVISDQRMPGMSGSEFLQKVREIKPDVIRLMITGYADIESVVAAINQGHVFRYISKPWDPAELEAVLRQSIEQYELINERQRLLKELEEANRMKTVFITVASHELNTPLMIATGMMELAISRSNDTNISSYLTRSMKAMRRLQTLLSNTFRVLQEESFQRAERRQDIVLAAVVNDIVQELDPFVKLRQQQIQVEIEPSHLAVHASPDHLRVMIENLLTNAIKFSPDQRTIYLRAVFGREKAGSRKRPARDGIIITVSDQGTGIAWEDQPHIFEPFFSTMDTMRHSSGEYGFGKRGSGLGLAIVKKFVELHEGVIDFETTPGQGTTFRIFLPNPTLPPLEQQGKTSESGIFILPGSWKQKVDDANNGK